MVKRIKVLFTIPNFDTAGSGKVLYDLVKYIDKKKFEPHICCAHTKGDFFKQVETLGIPIHVYSVASKYRPLINLPFRVLRTKKFFKKHKFDIVHSWHWSSDFTEPLAAKLSSIPFVYTKKAMGWGNRAWRWRSQLSSKIITINEDMEAQFFSDMADKILPIPIGLNVNDFGTLEKTYSNAEGYAINQDDFTIVSIANLVDVKGIEVLLEATKQMNYSKLKVFIVGDDTSDYAINLKKKYASPSVIFTGKKRDIKSYLAMADVFIIPTKDEGRKEGQPIAPIEAMMSGRVVLGSRISGIKDVLKPFQDCLFEPNSVDDLKKKIENFMVMDVEKRNELAKQMFYFSSKNYTIEKSIHMHEALYIKMSNS